MRREAEDVIAWASRGDSLGVALAYLRARISISTLISDMIGNAAINHIYTVFTDALEALF